MAAGAAALRDPDVFRVYVRRIGLLDSTAVLDRDTGLQQRIEQLFGQIAAGPKPPGWPSREEMSAAVGGGRG